MAVTSVGAIYSFVLQQVLHFPLKYVSLIVVGHVLFAILATTVGLQALSERVGARASMALAALLLAVAALVLTLLAPPFLGARGLPVVVVSTATYALGYSLITPNQIFVLTESVPREQVGRFLGLSMTVGAIGRAIGPAIGVYVFVSVGWRGAHYFAAALDLVMALFYGLDARRVPFVPKPQAAGAAGAPAAADSNAMC